MLSGTDGSFPPIAPPLSELERRYPVEHLAEALAEGIFVGGHGADMPELVLSPAEIDDLLAYLARIQR